MTRTASRRCFLRSTVGLVLAGLVGCTHEPRWSESGSSESGPVLLDRPLVRPFGELGVRIAMPLDARPAGYVSMATRQVFVDRAHRDRVSWLLDAHISVSTWVWRIPLPGDSPLTPIPPGDEPREFEELPIGAWDPSAPPALGDIRVVLGRPAPARIRARCAPVQGTDQRLTMETAELELCRAGSGEPVREDLGLLTRGRLHLDPECGDDGSAVDVHGWSCRG